MKSILWLVMGLVLFAICCDKATDYAPDVAILEPKNGAKFDYATTVMIGVEILDDRKADRNIRCLAVDSQRNIWIGTWDRGLAQFDGESWTVYNVLNSGLPVNNVSALAVDSRGNIWIGTRGGGLAVYHEGGGILPGTPGGVEEEFGAQLPSAFSLSQNYPNPFNAKTVIPHDVAKSSTVRLFIYALTGQHIRTLVHGERPAGS